MQFLNQILINTLKMSRVPPELRCSRLFNSRPTLNASPKSGLADEALDIRASGLVPGQSVTLQGEVATECGRYRFQSRANYTANEIGEVQVSSQPSLGGTYSGIEPMGLLWSALPMKKHLRKYPRLIKLDPTRPWSYTLSLIDGVCGTDDEDDSGVDHEVLDSIEIERHYLPSYVDMIPIERGPFKGTLYLPQEQVCSGSLPVIIDMTGGGPAPPNERSALLASHGFAVFRFNYFHPIIEQLKRNDSVYFDTRIFYDIVDFIETHPRLDAERIAINGSCLGGNLALNSLSRIPDLPIRCLNVQRCEDFMYYNLALKMPDGSFIEPAETKSPAGLFTTIVKEDGELWTERNLEIFSDLDHDANYVAPAENLSIPVSLIICGDDQSAPTEKTLIRAASRMMQAGKSHLVDVTYLEGAGHLLETPHIPLCKQSLVFMPNLAKDRDVAYINWGGQTIPHQRAQVTAWEKTINFFRRHLGPMEMCRHDWVDES